MKTILLTFVLAILAMQGEAQTGDTVLIKGKARTFKQREYIMIMFETLDTVDAGGKKSLFSRSYFFDKNERKMSSVREYSNPSNPARGTQVVYNFWQNRLTKVTVTPPRSRCENCLSEYYFSGDSISAKSEKYYKSADPLTFLGKADHFRSKVPASLPWGYFDDEVVSDGKKKKLQKRSY